MKLPKYQNSDKFLENIENSDFDRILSKILIFDRILPKISDFGQNYYLKFWFLTELYIKLLKLPKYQNSNKFLENIENSDFSEFYTDCIKFWFWLNFIWNSNCISKIIEISQNIRI